MKCERASRSVFPAVFLLLLLLSPAAGSKEAVLSEHEKALLRVCRGVIDLFKAKASSIWPGYDLSQKPFLVYLPQKWALLLNPAGPVRDFSSYPESWPSLGTRVLFRPGPYKDLIGQLAFDFEVEGVKTVAIGLPDVFPTQEARPAMKLFGYIVHEGFHQYQNEKFGEIPWEREEKYPILDVDNTALAALEMILLEQGLRAAGRGDRKLVEECAGEFIAARNERWRDGQSFVARYEQGQEIREGTAQYVEVKSYEVFKAMIRTPEFPPGPDPLEHDFQSAVLPELLTENIRARMSENAIAPDDMLRNRIYPVGASLGVLSDFLDIRWKEKAQLAGPEFRFDRLLEDRLNFDKNKSPVFLEKAKKDYGYARIVAAAEKLIKTYHEGYAGELKSFEAQPGIRVEIDFFYRGLNRARNSRAKTWQIDRGAVTLNSMFTVYTLKNDFLSLQLRNAGVLEKNDWDAKHKTVAFFTPKISSLLLDGNPAEPREGAEISFSRMAITEGDFTFECLRPGALSCHGRNVAITVAR